MPMPTVPPRRQAAMLLRPERHVGHRPVKDRLAAGVQNTSSTGRPRPAVEKDRRPHLTYAFARDACEADRSHSRGRSCQAPRWSKPPDHRPAAISSRDRGSLSPPSSGNSWRSASTFLDEKSRSIRSERIQQAPDRLTIRNLGLEAFQIVQCVHRRIQKMKHPEETCLGCSKGVADSSSSLSAVEASSCSSRNGADEPASAQPPQR